MQAKNISRMKYLFAIMTITMVFSLGLHSQTVVYQEGFEGATPSVTSAGTQQWVSNTTLYHTGTKSYSAQIVNPGDSSALTTTGFSTTGNTYVLLEFSHICKIEFFDAGTILVSNNNGSTWTQLTETHYIGGGAFNSITGNKFTSTTYSSWLPGILSTPANSWWQTEIFDISALASNSSQVLVKFLLRDINNGTQYDNWGWAIDDIKVTASIFELVPPAITLMPPVLADTVYSAGPFVVTSSIVDASGIDTAYIVYTVNAGTPDTVGMTKSGGNLYSGSIPPYPFNSAICYKVIAVDGSVSGNTAYFPFTGCQSFFTKQPMTGMYTVGGTGADYPSVTAALDAVTVAGVMGPVEFVVNPGTYTGQWTFGAIAGTSPVNTVTFRSSTSDPADVIWLLVSTPLNYYTVGFDNAEYIILKQITIRTNDTIYGRVIEFMTNSRHIIIDSCFIDAPLSTNTTSVPVYSTTGSPYNITISNCTLKGGYYGVYYHTTSASKKFRLNLVNNYICDFYAYGVYTYYVDSLYIVGNRLHNAPNSQSLYSMYIGYTTGWGVISKNRLISTNSGTNYGLAIRNKQATSTDYLLVSNNFITYEGTGSFGGSVSSVFIYNSNYINFYNNSIHVLGGGATGGRCFDLLSGAGINIVNNIFANTFGGYAYYIGAPAAVLTADYNNFYSTGNNFAYWGSAHNTLASLQTASGKEANSLNIQPPFTSTHDLTLTNTLLSAKGTFLASVPDDINGDPRLPVPAIGAHEIPLMPMDAGVSNFVTPTLQTIINEADTMPVTVTIMNMGTDTITNIDIFYSVNGGTPVLTTFTGLLTQFQTASVNLPSFTSPAGIVGICAWTTLPGDSNTYNDSICITYFATPTVDAGITRILPVEYGCGLGSDTISVVIRNTGVTTITGSFNVSYRLAGDSTIITETVTGPIALNDSLNFTFQTLAGFTTLVDSTFIVEAWVKVPGDNVLYNDTIALEVLSMYIPLPPVVSDTAIPYAGMVTLFAQSPDTVLWFPCDTSSIELATGAYFTTPILFDTTTWWVEAISVPSSMSIGTGVNIAPLAIAYASNCNIGPCSTLNDLNSGTCGTQQMWIYTSGGLTPHVDFIDFEWSVPYTMDKITIHHAFINSRFLSGGAIYVWSVNGWVFHHAFSNLPVTNCENDVLFPPVTTTKLRITSFEISGIQMSNPGFREIEIFSTATVACKSLRVPVTVNVGVNPIYDIGISELNVKEGCAVYNEPVTLKIFNQGTDTLKGGATASFRVNSDPWMPTETIIDTIAPGTSIYYTFNSPANLTAPLNNDTMFTITAWVNIPGDPNHQNDTIFRDSVMSLKTPAAPVVTSPVNISYGTQATLTVQSPIPVEWFASDTSTVLLDTGHTFITPPLFDTTTFWVQASSAMDTPVVLFTGPQGYFHNMPLTRGFHFTAPVNMTITELMVPTTVDTGPQYIQVVRFSGYPVAYPNINTYTTLAYISNAPFGIPVQVNLPIKAGDEIGIIGATNPSGTIMSNSIGLSQVPTSIGGIPVVLTRLEYQASLVSGPAPNFSIFLSAAPQIARVDITYVVDGDDCPSLRVPVQVNSSTAPAVDAGIDTVVHSLNNALSNIPHPIQVRLKNYGLNALTSASIVWSINNVVQDTLPWTGSLPWSATQVITLDTMVFSGGEFCIRAWTTLPNGVADTIPLNDTAHHCFNTCLAGIFTIGPATTGTWNYNTFNQALNVLQTCSICDHVIFDVQPGIYTEQLIIPEINGVGQNRTVTFRGSTGDSTQVTLQYTAAGSADCFTIRFYGADGFRFEKMTIKGLGASYARAVEFMAEAHYNTISNCVIEVPVGSSSHFVPIYSTSINNNFNKFINNHIKNGYYGIYWSGMSTTNLGKANTFEGNVIDGFYYSGTYFYRQDSLVFTRNTVIGLTGFDSGYGIYARECQNDVMITKNRIELAPAGTLFGGIYMYNCNGTAARRGLIANNFVSVTGTNMSDEQSAVRLHVSNQQDLLLNSVNVTSGSNTSRAIDIFSGTGNNIQSNYARNTSGGYAYYVMPYMAVSISDHNNWWSSGSNLAVWGANCPTLAMLQSMSGMEANSHNLNVPFVSNTDLHIPVYDLSAKAQYSSRVPDDIDGEPRLPLPNIGADEVSLIPEDAGVTAILSPGANTSEGQVYPVQVTVTNFGTDTIYPNTMTIQYTVNAGIPVSLVYTGLPIPSLGSATVLLPSMTSPAGNLVICAKTLLPGDSNLFNDEYCKTFFATPVNDAMVFGLVGLEDGCNIGTDTISIWIRNSGVNPINSPAPSTITVSYRIKPTAPVVTQIFNPVLMPNDSMLFHFSTLADFSVTSVDDTFRVKAWADLQGDNVKYNDTACSEVVSLHVPPPPVVNDTTIIYATAVTLFAQSPDTVRWYAFDTATIELSKGAFFTTPVLNTNTTYWVQAGTEYFPSSDPYVPGVNIAPQAVASASTCNAGSCSMLNDMNFGTCGTQQVWIQTTTPPSLLPHLNFIDFEWPAAVSIDGMKIHHAQNDGRFLTGATLYRWDAGNWVSFHTFSNLPMQCENTVPFPMVTTSKLRITTFQMTGLGQLSNPGFREIEIFEVLASECNSIRVPLTVTISNQQPCDVGISEILHPVTAVNLGSQEDVTVMVRNYGTAAQSNIPVSYKVDNLPFVTETITATIGSQDSLNYTFAAKANLSISGNTYQIKACTGLSCDSTPQNDTAWKSVTNLLPNYCISTATSAMYQEITNVSIGNMFSNTSPAVGAMYTDHTTTVTPPMLSPGFSCPMSITSDFSPGYSSQNNCWVKAWIDFNRDGIFDPLTEEIFSQATTSNNTVAANIQIPFNTLCGNAMMRVVLTQISYAAGVTPCNTYTYGETEDYLVFIAPHAQCDAGVIQIITPPSLSQAGTPLPVWVRFMNLGDDPIAPGALSVAYKLNNAAPVVVAYQFGLPSGGTDSIQMPDVTLPMGNNTLCAYTILACDTAQFNNEACAGVYGQYQTTLPFFDDFESANIWYNPPAAKNWQYGTPSANIIGSAYSGSKAWVTNLTGDYTNNADDYLYTPVFSFMGLGGNDTVSISFWQYCAMLSGDYGRVQYTIDGGHSWISLGAMGDVNGTNWYNVSSGGQNYFSHTNSVWMYSAYKLDPNIFNSKPEVQFRFHFYSNASGISNGWAIDNFRLSLPIVPDDVGVSAINIPLNDTAAGTPVNVSITISNFGTNTQSIILVELRLNGNIISSETWTGTLASDSTTQYTFVLPYTVPATSYNLCARTILPNDQYAINDEICKSYSPLPAYDDVGIMVIVEPLPDSNGIICFYNAVTPWAYFYSTKVRIRNFGQNTQTSIPISYSFLTGGLINTDTWNGTLMPDDSVDFVLTEYFKPYFGTQQVCAETTLPNDMIAANNKACRSYYGIMCPIGIDDQDAGGLVLTQNIPNPAKGTTVIGYSVPQEGGITFGLLNMVGQMMYNENHTVEAGDHQIEYDVSTLAAGVYYYYIEYNGQRLTRKMVVGR